MKVHEKVCRYITENNLKQVTVAEKCNISLSSFNAMMRGSEQMYADDLRAICYALEIPPEYFIDFQMINRSDYNDND